MKQLILIVLATVVLGGCSGVKNLQRPQLNVPATYEVAGEGCDSASVADMNWWEFYTDSTLRRIMAITLEHNHDLLKAAARVEEMRELYGVAKSAMLPEIGGSVEYTNETNNYAGHGVTKDPEYDLKFPISWEINLWGAMNWAKKQGAANYRASVEDYRAMRMTLIAEVASTYFRLVALNNELAIVRQTLTTREQSLQQALLRFEGGLTSETVYQQAKVEYATTASLIPSIERQLVATRNALSLLMGQYPDSAATTTNLTFDVTLPERLPAGVPSQLLERRPDVRAAEARLQGAMAAAGMTYANRFPNLRIGFTPGFENDEFAHFFKSPFTYVLGSIAGPIFDFGKRKRRYKAAVATYEQARLSYEKAVMTSFTEVRTALSAYHYYREVTHRRVELRDAAAKYVQLAHLQYRGGTLNYIDVLDAQRRYFDAQLGVNNSLRDEYLALVNIYKVLGGGWQVADYGNKL